MIERTAPATPRTGWLAAQGRPRLDTARSGKAKGKKPGARLTARPCGLQGRTQLGAPFGVLGWPWGATICATRRRKGAPTVTVFVCATDESADENPRDQFFYGGFSAPLGDWESHFAEAWRERVLDGTPRLTYLHMADVRKHLSWHEADERIDEASRVIRSTGSLIPVVVSLEQRTFDKYVRQGFEPRSGAPEATLVPDYICFVCFAVMQLILIHGGRPEAERVDFWVENNGPVTRNLAGFHASLAGTLPLLGYRELAPLVGEYREVRKEEIAAQAADVLCWHARRAKAGTLDRTGQRRYWRMTTNGSGTGSRYGYRRDLETELLKAIGEGIASYPGRQ